MEMISLEPAIRSRISSASLTGARVSLRSTMTSVGTRISCSLPVQLKARDAMRCRLTTA